MRGGNFNKTVCFPPDDDCVVCFSLSLLKKTFTLCAVGSVIAAAAVVATFHSMLFFPFSLACSL